MNHEQITGWSRQQTEISARRERTINKAISLLLALAVCAMFVGWLDSAVVWQTRSVPVIAHGSKA